MEKSIAVIGAGCAGLAAAWALNEHSPHKVTLYEANERLGGHTNTVDFCADGKHIRVDTGFIIYNSATYPNFMAFLREIGVRGRRTEMSFGVSRDGGCFEWAGSTLSGIFAQRGNLVSPSFYHMLFDIVRFNYCSAEVLSWDLKHPRARESMDEYLAKEGYCAAFRNDYLVPMTAAVWSTGPTACASSFPIMTLVRFMWNHHLLNTVTARPDWLTIPGGSWRYVERIAQRLPSVKLRSPVRRVERRRDGVVIATDEGTHTYDHVIFASHADSTLAFLDADLREKEVLEHFHFTVNTAVLHADERLMPRRRRAWTSWNYIDSSSSNGGNQTCLTYCMNSLQHISWKHGPVLVTLNPIIPPRHQQGEWTYAHPLYTPDSVAAQTGLAGLQGRRRSHFCGAWTKYGFHEDAFSSGIRAAMDLGAELPFAYTDAMYSRGSAPQRGWREMLVQWILMLLHLLFQALPTKSLRIDKQE